MKLPDAADSMLYAALGLVVAGVWLLVGEGWACIAAGLGLGAISLFVVNDAPSS